MMPAILWTFTLATVSVAALSVSGWLVYARLAEGGASPASKIQTAMDQEAAKPRATGRLGDFVIFPETAKIPPEANIFACANGEGTAPVPPDASLRADELWSDAFADGGMGWSCPGQGLVLVNNEDEAGHGAHGDGAALIRGYIRTTPVSIVRDAPLDRLELVTVEGHPGLIEHPIPGYPYAEASLVVIERFPQRDLAGIVVFVEFAPSAAAAIKHAEDIMP
jgi:hypothetical protein